MNPVIVAIIQRCRTVVGNPVTVAIGTGAIGDVRVIGNAVAITVGSVIRHRDRTTHSGEVRGTVHTCDSILIDGEGAICWQRSELNLWTGGKHDQVS